jgi:hypothetical protein
MTYLGLGLSFDSTLVEVFGDVSIVGVASCLLILASFLCYGTVRTNLGKRKLRGGKG